jgi:hypothetical protein
VVGIAMITEFQLWVLSTIVMLAVIIVSVKLPDRVWSVISIH